MAITGTTDTMVAGVGIITAAGAVGIMAAGAAGITAAGVADTAAAAVAGVTDRCFPTWRTCVDMHGLEVRALIPFFLNC
jgi:hypothetical protein